VSIALRRFTATCFRLRHARSLPARLDRAALSLSRSCNTC
jgi:hypothetical protein